ncbi:MAG TPA: metalloregulator ArsR/SmtB family transcription factor [Candidatus Limnocylindria bacterium]|nr:metalloregulator ArsR/SmtB family transcription factor [Candidatus Limnocylindria bacterium]
MIKNHYDMTTSRTTTGEQDLRRLRTLYRALGDETRLRMIALMAELGPVPVKTLSARVGLSQPLISWHLRILRLAGLIDTRRQGREVICKLRLAAFEELHEAEARLVAGTAGIDMPPATAGSEAPNVG